MTIKGVKTADGNSFEADAVILATGHSARDIFELLHAKKILIEAKPFALGVRVEHPQALIDSSQYHCAVQEVNFYPRLLIVGYNRWMEREYFHSVCVPVVSLPRQLLLRVNWW